MQPPAEHIDLVLLSPPAGTPPPHSPSRRRRPTASSDEDSDGDYDDTYGAAVGVVQGRKRRPVFFPPLWLARRTECVQLIQSENSRSVVDFGCGAGAVLSFLALPAYHRDEWPPAPPSLSTSTSSRSVNHTRVEDPAALVEDPAALVASIPPPPPRRRGLHLSRLVGVDGDLSACQMAAKACEPRQGDGEDELRWDELRTEVWHGGVEVYSPALESVDAFVMTEVIEHLSESALSRIPNLLFSVYKPRVVIITTPNHTFNPYFPAPSSSSTERPTWSRSALPPPSSAEDHPSHLFPDPTGRTKRVFRDETHTLEWTPDEFRSWCADALRSAGAEGDYDVEYSGVGSLEAYYRSVEGGVPFPPPALALHPALAEHPLCTAPIGEPERFFATQIAVFRRRDGASSSSGAAAAAAGEEEEQAQQEEEEERVSRSLHVSPINSYAPLPPLDSPLAASTSPVLPSTSPRAPHALVAASTLPAHPSAALPPPTTARERATLRVAVRAAFCAARRGPVLSVEEVWRMGDRALPLPGASEGDEEPRPTEPLRVLARGTIGAVVDALVHAEGDGEPAGEWGLERLSAPRGGAGELCGAEALGVRWARYDEVVEELERREREEADRAWAEREGGTFLEEDDEDEAEEAGSAGEVDPLEGRLAEMDVGVEQGEAQQAGWGAPRAVDGGREGDSSATHSGWQASVPAPVTMTTTSGWGDDPW
ncbi:hypothetical protein JCM8208_003244 [Rhodotorula glutinis]